MDLKLNRLNLWRKLHDPDYRSAFVSATVAARLAVRIFNLRKKVGWSQSQLAEKAKMKQARISVLEQGDYENFTFSTLKKIAAAFNVAAIVDFVSFPDFVKWSDGLNSESVVPQSFDDLDRGLAAAPVVAVAVGQAAMPAMLGRYAEAAKQSPDTTNEDLLRATSKQQRPPLSGPFASGRSNSELFASVE